ncbi:MAG TPA: arsenate reductase ArsC [Syntrophobacteria bacterium]|jgi:arsenate reductase|nr:arsenate reductase ArsC [Syntrophobacteria bacterium]
MEKRRVLFISPLNDSRSQMAEALFNSLVGGEYEAWSAGFQPGELSPVTIQVMREIGVDISTQRTKKLFELYRSGMVFNHIVTLCDVSVGEKSPIYPNHRYYIEWSTPDPDAFEGPKEERTRRLRQCRDGLKRQIAEWLHELSVLQKKGVRTLFVAPPAQPKPAQQPVSR